MSAPMALIENTTRPFWLSVQPMGRLMRPPPATRRAVSTSVSAPGRVSSMRTSCWLLGRRIEPVTRSAARDGVALSVAAASAGNGGASNATSAAILNCGAFNIAASGSDRLRSTGRKAAFPGALAQLHNDQRTECCAATTLSLRKG
jgi:hypothetical protein